MSNTVPLFEKLIDENIDIPFEKNPQKTSSLAEFQEYIIEDLRRLLNTRLSIFWIEFAEKNYTIPYSYGINVTPDISSENTEDIRKLEGRIKKVIEQFEPRLNNVSVRVLGQGNDPSFLFVNIDALVLFKDRKTILSFPVIIQP